MKLPVYSRADLSRIVALVVAPSLAAGSTSAVAREFRIADTRNEDDPTVQALRCMGSLIAERCGEQTGAGAIDLNRTKVALVRTFVPAVNVPAIRLLFRLIEHAGLAARLIYGANSNRPSFVTTDHYKYAGDDTLTGPAMPPEVVAEPVERIRKIE